MQCTAERACSIVLLDEARATVFASTVSGQERMPTTHLRICVAKYGADTSHTRRTGIYRHTAAADLEMGQFHPSEEILLSLHQPIELRVIFCPSCGQRACVTLQSGVCSMAGVCWYVLSTVDQEPALWAVKDSIARLEDKDSIARLEQIVLCPHAEGAAGFQRATGQVQGPVR